MIVDWSDCQLWLCGSKHEQYQKRRWKWRSPIVFFGSTCPTLCQHFIYRCGMQLPSSLCNIQTSSEELESCSRYSQSINHAQESGFCRRDEQHLPADSTLTTTPVPLTIILEKKTVFCSFLLTVYEYGRENTKFNLMFTFFYFWNHYYTDAPIPHHSSYSFQWLRASSFFIPVPTGPFFLSHKRRCFCFI